VTKQVKGATVAQAEVAQSSQNRNLFVSVNTFDVDGKPVGTRVVDMYHYGTRNWLQNHLWWAMHNGHSVEQAPASDDEVDNYLASQKEALATKFNGGEPVAKAA